MGQGTRPHTAHQLARRGHPGELDRRICERAAPNFQGINMTNDMEFMSALIFDAYMADAITENEVRRACAILNITFPPQQHKGITNEHSNNDFGPVWNWKNNQPAQPQPH